MYEIKGVIRVSPKRSHLTDFFHLFSFYCIKTRKWMLAYYTSVIISHLCKYYIRNHFRIDVNQTIILHAINIFSDAHHLYFTKLGGKDNIFLHIADMHSAMQTRKKITNRNVLFLLIKRTSSLYNLCLQPAYT